MTGFSVFTTGECCFGAKEIDVFFGTSSTNLDEFTTLILTDFVDKHFRDFVVSIVTRCGLLKINNGTVRSA